MAKTLEQELKELLYLQNIILLPEQKAKLILFIKDIASEAYGEGYETAYG